MNTKAWIIFALVTGVAGTAGVLVSRTVDNAAKPAAPKVEFPVPYGLTVEIAGLLQQRDYANAMPLLQARFEQVKNDKKAVEQVKYYTGVCAKGLGQSQFIGRVGEVADPTMDPSTGQKRVPHAPLAAGETRTMGIKELGNFDYDAEKGGEVPEDVLALNGGTIRLSGYMLPLSQSQYMTEFALVPTLFNCCFGQPPGVQHVVTAHLPKGKGVEYTIYEVSVEGTIKVDVRRKDEYTESIFEMDATSVKVLGKKN